MVLSTLVRVVVTDDRMLPLSATVPPPSRVVAWHRQDERAGVDLAGRDDTERAPGCRSVLACSSKVPGEIKPVTSITAEAAIVTGRC